jgi:hypothetical protein
MQKTQNSRKRRMRIDKKTTPAQNPNLNELGLVQIDHATNPHSGWNTSGVAPGLPP